MGARRASAPAVQSGTNQREEALMMVLHLKRRPSGQSDLAAVISPVQQSLALASATGEMTRLAVTLNLAHMPSHGFPTVDLT